MLEVIKDINGNGITIGRQMFSWHEMRFAFF